MSLNCLIHFNNEYLVKTFIKEYKVEDWIIKAGRLNERGKEHINKTYVTTLKRLFNEKDLFYKEVSIAEVISWLDNLVHIKRLSDYLRSKVTASQFSVLEFIFEYKVKYAKNGRIDLLVKYNNTLCIVEFKNVDKFSLLRGAYREKGLEVLLYEKTLKTTLKKDYKIYSNVFIGLVEECDEVTLNNHIDNNKKNVRLLGDYIIDILIKKSKLDL